MMFNFAGKTVFITGASSGLGEQFARCLSKAGARVILAARRFDKLNSLAAELGNAKSLALDVSDKAAVTKTFEELDKSGEKIDICINNAGIAEPTPIFEEDKDGFERVVQTNLMGAWYVTKASVLHMSRHGISGSIINIGSIAGDAVPVMGGAAYNVSKAAVIHLTKSLVGELSLHKIRINCICPGWVKTPMTGPAVDHVIDKITDMIPSGHVAQPSDLDGLILYLASNSASQYVTGACFTIDGGMSWGGFVYPEASE